jgi:two-component system response regulator NreC
MRKIRILLADDHAVLRAGLRSLLEREPDMEVVGEAGDGLETVRQAKEFSPDVVVMDLTMPRMDGMEATREMSRLGLPSKVLALTMHDDEQYLYRLIEAGGAGYILKSSADTDLMVAIRTVFQGGVFLYVSAATGLLRDYLERTRSAGADPFDGLSQREVQVLRLTAEGYSNQEIGRRLALSTKTVDSYRGRIMEKLDLHHRSELIRYALRKGLLQT